MKYCPIPTTIAAVVALILPACHHEADHAHHEHQNKILVTRPEVKDVVFTRSYVCQIHSQRHIEICALENGYIQKINVKEGQAVQQGEVMFKILPPLYQAKLDAEQAEARLAQINFDNTKRLNEQGVVSVQEVALKQAELDRAKAKAALAQAELNFTDIKAPYSGIVDRLMEQLGSLVDAGDVLTTLSDNSVLWVYFNVPEAQYLEYLDGLKYLRQQNQTSMQVKVGAKVKAASQKQDDDKDDDDDDRDDDDRDGHDNRHAEELRHVELVLANGQKFSHIGTITAIEAKFNNQTGTVPFRADFPNPEGLLRHGQTGTILIHRTLPKALVIPQRATFEILDKRYVFVVDKEGVVHQRLIKIGYEQDDIFIIKDGLTESDQIVLEGVREVQDGEKIEFEFEKPEKALSTQKYHAE
ncbi:MAG: efflux RND transporter periplasmic adaptor subunit [Bacteroidales bacterium]|nr:efflux RND transporter periplasmic adaptor subunit [Bacteroidales bacterium]